MNALWTRLKSLVRKVGLKYRKPNTISNYVYLFDKVNNIK